MPPTYKTKPFRSGNSQAVRLPKAFAFPEGTELEMVREGDVVTLRPAKISMKQMIEELRRLPKPPYVEVRDLEDIPERPGL
jgi:antitoxin VapB